MKVQVTIDMEDYIRVKSYVKKLRQALRTQTEVIKNVSNGIEDIMNNTPVGKVNLANDGRAINAEGEIGYDIQGWLNYISDNAYNKDYADVTADNMEVDI